MDKKKSVGYNSAPDEEPKIEEVMPEVQPEPKEVPVEPVVPLVDQPASPDASQGEPTVIIDGVDTRSASSR